MFAPQTELLNSLARDLDHMLSDLSYEGGDTPSKYNNSSVGRLISSKSGALNEADVMSGQKRFLQLNNNHTLLQEENAVSSSCSELEDTPPCQMTLTERLIRCHPVWFLPGIHRSGAEHLLQGKPPGSFIVRESSKCSTMALSVRLPAGKGPHVEHFLIEVHAGKLCLETLDHRFDNISSLIAHYCTHSDELPTMLRLPDALLRAESRHQLSSLALLGQEFWQSRLSCGSGVASVQCGSAGSANSSPASSLSKPCVTSSGAGSVSSLTGVSAGELSSFQQPRRSCEEAGVMLNLVPICEETADTAGGGQQRRPSTLSLTAAAAPTAALRSPALVSGVYNPPPKPPPRWSKPAPASVRTELSVLVPGGRLVRSAASTPVTAGGSAAVCWPPGRRSPVTTPASCDDDLISSHQQQRRRRARRKRSAHYQEADILESAGCCRSALADKISDYEDIWASPPRDLVAPSISGSSSFKPRTPARSLNDLTQTDVMARISQDRERRAEQLHAQRRRARPLHGSAASVTRGSPLYAVPADAVQAAAPSRRAVPFQRRAVHRHSEPNIRWEPPGRGPPLPTIHQAVPVQPPRVQLLEYEADTEDAGEEHEMPRRRRLEPEETRRRLEQDDSIRRREDSEEPPELTRDEQSRLVQEIVRQSMCLAAGDAPSEYDNVCRRPPPEPPAAAAGDPSKWESIVRLMTDQLRLRTGQFDESCAGAVSVGTGAGGGFTDSESFVNVGPETLLTDEEDSRPDARRRTSAAAHHPHDDPVNSAPRLNTIRLHRESRQTGPCIRDYVLQLAADDSNTFSLSIYNFIQCTREGSATELQVVMRNMRQFINGMKNYLVKHGEGDFHCVVLRERDKLSCTEFLNLDAILEGVLEELLVLPLHSFLLQLWSRDHQLLHQLPAAQLLGPAAAPSADTLHSVRQQLERLEATLSPLDKLETLLQTVSTLFCGQQLPADQLLPLLLYSLVNCQVNHIEFECEYMLGLVHPLLLDGEAGYYLAMLSSAVHVMKNMLGIGRPDGTSPSLSPATDSTHNSVQTETVCSGTLESVLRVLVPDESCGTILTRTLPTRPDMCSRQVCQMLAHRLRITSPQDYGLFQLVDGHETLLSDSDLPQQMKHNQLAKQQHCMIAYKRLDAKIAWPTAQIL